MANLTVFNADIQLFVYLYDNWLNVMDCKVGNSVAYLNS